jgi:hypothetical protein
MNERVFDALKIDVRRAGDRAANMVQVTIAVDVRMNYTGIK